MGVQPFDQVGIAGKAGRVQGCLLSPFRYPVQVCALMQEEYRSVELSAAAFPPPFSASGGEHQLLSHLTKKGGVEHTGPELPRPR